MHFKLLFQRSWLTCCNIFYHFYHKIQLFISSNRTWHSYPSTYLLCLHLPFHVILPLSPQLPFPSTLPFPYANTIFVSTYHFHVHLPFPLPFWGFPCLASSLSSSSIFVFDLYNPSLHSWGSQRSMFSLPLENWPRENKTPTRTTQEQQQHNSHRMSRWNKANNSYCERNS